MSKPVTFAQLHDVIHVPGVGQFDKSLKLSTKTLADFKIELEDGGHLTVSWTEGKYSKQMVVGAAMVKAVVLAPQLIPEPSKK